MLRPAGSVSAPRFVGPGNPRSPGNRRGGSRVTIPPMSRRSVLIRAFASTFPGRSWCRVVNFGLALVVVGFLFEAAIHSVHHLGDDDQAEECWLASAAANI